MVGKNLSHYKILEELGRGGMGIVYKAEDTKLDRTVAIKVLPSAALASEEDRARFYREAKAAAQLHHPHIASVFEIDEAVPEGSKDDDLRPFIAMEYIEGETLRARIEKGPLKLEEAARIGGEIASALEAAHEKNIVHRDIKSANVMLTTKGSAKVLDFGLAKTAQSTMLTRMGSTLGTVTYMSPEQTRGEDVDLRSDIWSLGVVLYEMITGKHPFAGDYEQAVTYSILNEMPEPPTAIRTGVPMQLEWMVNKCLAKNPDERYQSAKDLLVDLKTIDLKGSASSMLSGSVSATTASVVQAPVSAVAQASTPGRQTWKLVAGVFLLVAISAGASWVIRGNLGVDSEQPVQRLKLGFEGISGFLDSAISPDEKHIAMVATDSLGRFGLHIYTMSTGKVRFVESSGGIRRPRFSPDGSRLAFVNVRSNTIEYLLLPNGAPITVAGSGNQPDWLSDEEILYTSNVSVARKNISGGEESVVFHPDSAAGQTEIFYSRILPSRNSTLLSVVYDDRSVSIGVGNIATGQITVIRERACCAQYVSGGHILYHVGGPNGQVVAAPFDERTGLITGPSVDILPPTNYRSIYVSQNGTLLYVDGIGAPIEKLSWLSDTGTEDDLGLEEIDILDVSLSPDGKTAAIETRNVQEGIRDIILMDLATGTPTRLSFKGNSYEPAWSADGLYVFYRGQDGRATGPGIYRKLADLSASEEFILAEAGDPNLSMDGRWMAYSDGQSESNLSVFDLQNDERIVVDSAATIQDQPAISPNGRYVAFRSRQAGQEEVYVRSMDGTGFWSISSGEGHSPEWSPDGNYIYFRGNLWTLWRVRVTTTPSFQRISSPEMIRGQAGQLYFTPDRTSGRLLIATRGRQNESAETELVNIVQNFPEELKRIAPPSR